MFKLKKDSKEGTTILELGRTLAELHDRAADFLADIPAEGRRAVVNVCSRCATMNVAIEEVLASISSLKEAM